MDTLPPFEGFTPQSLRFFAALKRNNNRAWFNVHKQQYMDLVFRPAQSFVADMAPVLGRIFPGIVADPAPGGSIFRIHRDTRFSADKQPYKTHLGVLFWQSGGRKMERPGFYFELDDRGVRLYYGWYIFPPDLLRRYRQAVADDKTGLELVRAKKAVERSGIAVGGQFYKRIPRDHPVDESRADLMRHNTLYTEQDCGRPRELFSRSLIPYAARRWNKCMPVYRWVQQIL